MHTEKRGPRPPRYWFRRALGVFILVIAMFGVSLFESVLQGRALDETAIRMNAFQHWPTLAIGGAAVALLASIWLRSVALHRRTTRALDADEFSTLPKLPIGWSLFRWVLVSIYGLGVLAFSMVGIMGVGLVPAGFCLCMAVYLALSDARAFVVAALICLAALVGLTWAVLMLVGAAAYAR